MFLVFLILAFFKSPLQAQEVKDFWAFKECGQYRATGRLILTPQHHFILQIQPKTRLYKEVFLMSANVKEVMGFLNKNVEVKFQVYRVKIKDESNKALLLEIKKATTEKNEVFLDKKMPCS